MLTTPQRHALLFCAALALAAGGTTARAEGTSQWSSPFGPMTLSVSGDMDVTGSYPNFLGQLAGYLSDEGKLEMYWVQPKSELRCRQARDNQFYWGRVSWKVLPGGVLKGKWAYCDTPLADGEAWNARFISGAPIEEMVGTHEPLRLPQIPATGKPPGP